MKKRMISVICGLSMAVMALAGMNVYAEDVIKIGVFEPQTGENGGGGLQELQGARYANEIRPTVTIDGTEYKVELDEVDNKSDKTEAVTAAQKLVADGVVAVIGSYGSGVSIAAGPTFAEAQIPAVGCSCTNPQVTNGCDYYFRVCFLDPFQGSVMAQYAFDEGYKNVAVIDQLGDDYSTGLANFFIKQFETLGGTIAHGSNSIWDKYCANKGKLRNGERTDGQELQPGTAVFTEAEDGRHNHIGLYTGNGLVIEAQGTQAGVVTSLVTNKKWKAWGELKGVSYAEGGEKEMKKATVVLPSGASGSTVNMRESASRSAKIVCQVPVGASVDVIQDKGEWCYIQYNGKTGYMMSNYLEYEGQDGESGDYLSPEEIAEIQKALKDIENATETIGRIVGRG